jgi:serine/threonine-protein kinase
VLALLWRRRSAVAPSGEFSEPDRVGPYRVERLLGRGGFASTYLAHHEGTGQRVALKRLHPYRLDDPEFLGRFRQEAQLGSRLVHPHLVRLVDPGPSDGPPWLAMEYIEGRRLDEYLKSAGPLPPEEVLSLARGMADGLTYAHAQGVVHRDLKPANILMAEGGVKIMDFGIARVMDAETLTTTYAFLGTPRYAAPEAQLKTTIGPAADWYSFGIILFELLSGRPPFQGETPFEILDRHRAEPLPDLRLLRPGLPASLVELVEALCAKDPEARPRDAEVLRCLAEAQAQNTRSSAT